MKIQRFFGVLTLLATFTFEPARAEIITFDFTGTVSLAVCGNELCDPSKMLGNSVRINSTVSGYYSFDTLSQGVPFHGSGGGMLNEGISYNGINGSFVTIIGDYEFGSLPNSPIYISVADDFYGTSNTMSSDQYRVLTRTGITSTKNSLPELVGINTMNLEFIKLGTLGQTVDPLTSAFLPTDPETINGFGGGSLLIGLNFAQPIDNNTRLILSISVPTVNFAPVPEPSTSILIVLGGMVGAIFLRRRSAAQPFAQPLNGALTARR